MLLLNSIGAKYFNMVSSLAAPKAATELKYDELLKLLENHLAPKKNVLVAQHKFLSKYQTEGKSVAEFVAELRNEINDCKFISPCQCEVAIDSVFLRAQFIRGICDNNIREQLLQSSDCDFEEIVSKALALEAAKIDAKALSYATSSNNATQVNKIFNKKPYKPVKKQHKPRIDYKRLGIAGLCLRCGKNNHFARECLSKNLKCNLCSKQGHVGKVCITSRLAEGSKSKKPRLLHKSSADGFQLWCFQNCKCLSY